MISLDDVEKNKQFAESLDADLVLLSDPEKLVAGAYGVVDWYRPFPRRWTFFIDAAGTIVHIDKEVQPGTAGQDIAAWLERLDFPKSAAPDGAAAEDTAPTTE